MDKSSENLLRLRKKLGWTQEKLAQKLGYKSKSTINKIETGINGIPPKKIAEFAKVLGTTPAELMGWEEQKTQKIVLTPADREFLFRYKLASKETRKLVLKMLELEPDPNDDLD